MGVVIDLAARRQREPVAAGRRPAARRGRGVEFLFDLADPWTYLIAERVDRELAGVRWTPASTAALTRRHDALAGERGRCAAEARASVLRLPLQWPDRYGAEVPGAMRAATLAAERGRGGEFVLAAGRLAFCGGFDLDDPEILAEAAAAAGLGLEETLAAARDGGRDGAIDAAARRLLAAGGDRLPALLAGRRAVCGEDRIAAVASALPAR